MRLLALLSPAAMLAMLSVLERLEVWMSAPTPRGRAHPRRAARFPSDPVGRRTVEEPRRG